LPVDWLALSVVAGGGAIAVIGIAIIGLLLFNRH
jgi:hypothetical protein